MIFQVTKNQQANGGMIPKGTMCFGSSRSYMKKGERGFYMTTLNAPEGFAGPQTIFVKRDETIMWGDTMDDTNMAMAIVRMSLAAKVEESDLVLIQKEQDQVNGFNLTKAGAPIMDETIPEQSLFGSYVEGLAQKMHKEIAYV